MSRLHSCASWPAADAAEVGRSAGRWAKMLLVLVAHASLVLRAHIASIVIHDVLPARCWYLLLYITYCQRTAGNCHTSCAVSMLVYWPRSTNPRRACPLTGLYSLFGVLFIAPIFSALTCVISCPAAPLSTPAAAATSSTERAFLVWRRLPPNASISALFAVPSTRSASGYPQPHLWATRLCPPPTGCA